MRQIQLYLEEASWKALHIQSRQSGESIFALIRQAVREKYMSGSAYRREAMWAVAGLWKNRTDLPETETYLRQLRKGSRMKRMVR